jgi:hypothetical protein
MPAPDEPQVTLVRVGGSRSRTARTWVALVAVGVVSAAIVGVGLLGGGSPDGPRSVPSAATAADPSTGPAPPRGSGSTTSALGVRRSIAPANAGYEVDYPRDNSHRPIVTQGGALAIFGFGERVPDGSYPGVISVAVGTPARGAPVLFEGGSRSVYGASLDELAGSYFGDESRIPAVRSAFGVDGSLGLLLDFDPPEPGAPTRSVALFAHGNRTFVIESVGFDELFRGLRNAASAGLVRFLAGFRFTAPLHVSATLGYQAVPPEGMEAQGAPGETVVFTDGPTGTGFSRSIAIAVWVPQRGAVLRPLTQSGDRQDSWVSAGSAPQVEPNYVESRPGAVLSRTRIQVGGLEGEIVEQEGEPTAVFVVRGNRTYIFTVASEPPGSGLDSFWTFLETVAFFGE